VGKLVVVKDDAVEGTDKHNVSGTGTIPGPPGTAPYAGVASYSYKGKMTDALSDFVKIDGVAVATVASKSSLNPGETAPGGGHWAGSGSGFLPPTPTPIPASLSIPEPVGEGKPSATAGSSFVKVGGDKVLLDADKIDSCDGLHVPMNSTVTASGQSFVSCSA
jgi:hypothetical protein